MREAFSIDPQLARNLSIEHRVHEICLSITYSLLYTGSKSFNLSKTDEIERPRERRVEIATRVSYRSVTMAHECDQSRFRVTRATHRLPKNYVYRIKNGPNHARIVLYAE